MALVDVVRSEFRGSNDKLIWVIIIVFLNIIGALLYFFIGRNQRIS
ncbi:PLDc N-terminal domain-containing protein [Spirosoma aerolatum]|nr:PLD nuclease N-terminal domain-containing protein [Spirosoma aerolatum]